MDDVIRELANNLAGVALMQPVKEIEDHFFWRYKMSRVQYTDADAEFCSSDVW